MRDHTTAYVAIRWIVLLFKFTTLVLAALFPLSVGMCLGLPKLESASNVTIGVGIWCLGYSIIRIEKEAEYLITALKRAVAPYGVDKLVTSATMRALLFIPIVLGLLVITRIYKIPIYLGHDLTDFLLIGTTTLTIQVREWSISWITKLASKAISDNSR